MKPLAITMGCPVGIGPELLVKWFAEAERRSTGPAAVVVGDPDVLTWCARSLGLPAPLSRWRPGEAPKPGTIAVYAADDSPRLDPRGLRWGCPDSRTGAAMGRWIECAVRLALAGDVCGIVTCPISKKALNMGGYAFPGHTEMLASLCRSDSSAMMLAGPQLKVTLVTIHMPLASVAAALNTASVLEMIEITGRALRDDFALPLPRLAVAALNPHAGEEGMFGDEEARLIAPAIRLARERGWDAQGPFPPDTVFYKAASGAFDAVVCMYHDQGLIPFKLLHFADGVNVTLGLPLVRTSVDHGTAYDIAGSGRAAPTSLAAAVQMAAMIAVNRAARSALPASHPERA